MYKQNSWSIAGAALSVAVGVALAVGPSTQTLAAPNDIYPPPDRAHADLDAALRSAASTHRRVILDFGGNWCPDCRVLDIYFHDDTNKPLLETSFIVVHVNIGQADQFHSADIPNGDIAVRYRIPLAKGVPALAVLDSHGRLLHSQKTGEFESMRHMQSGAVTEFLDRWKPPSPH